MPRPVPFGNSASNWPKVSSSPTTAVDAAKQHPEIDTEPRNDSAPIRARPTIGAVTWTDRWLRADQDPRLLVVGGASLDLIHVDGAPMATPGGAGLYTALAAARAGVAVTMLAPVPDPMPAELRPALGRIRWVGPIVSLDGLPRFEIAYDEAGSVTLFREHLGAEPDMTPALLDMLDDVPACAYCVPFLDARLQQAFIAALADRGCLTVASTYGVAARHETEVVRLTATMADLFFCNADEAEVLFGGVQGATTAPGRLRFVTRGSDGATVFQGALRTDVAGRPTRPLDPTGAGDTFCGTAVARLLVGDHPVHAARRANAAAAETVADLGPRALWSTAATPQLAPDQRVVVDRPAVTAMAHMLRDLPALDGHPFVGDLFPPAGHPGALDWWFAATLQQYGFWYEGATAEGMAYRRPMVATIDGVERKGSDYLWAQYLRWWTTDPAVVQPTGQSAIDVTAWSASAAADDGDDPYPDSDQRAALCRSFGDTMTAIGVSAADIVTAAASSPRPYRSLLRLLDHVGGYREDPWRKKAALLGLVLRQRPEHFLPDAPDDDAPPIVDYHVQRTALRTGMVAVVDSTLRTAIAARRVIAAADEEAVRAATFVALQLLRDLSGRPMGAVDWFLFQMRHRCPEMSEPDCERCPAVGACARRVELFQPVFRTTAY
jgi:sugar/nucleoside kinase (ribokinase family)